MQNDKPKKRALWDITVKRIKEADLSHYAVMIAFYMMLSLLPLAMMAGILLPYFHISAETIYSYLSMIVPASILDALWPMVISVLTAPLDGGLLSLSVLTTLWSASKGMRCIHRGVDSSYGLSGSQHFITSRIFAVITLIVALVLLMALVMLLSYGEIILQQLSTVHGWAERIQMYLRASKWPATFLIIFFVVLVVYRLAPSIRLRLRDVWVGAFIVTACQMVLVHLFAWYLQYSTLNRSAFGFYGVIFLLMVWLRTTGFLILTGSTINAVRFELKGGVLITKRNRIDQLVDRINKNIHKFFYKRVKCRRK